MKKDVILIALGGNAILQSGQDAGFESQFENVSGCCKWLAPLAEKSTMIITHGNGPQVGNLLLQQNLASGHVPAMPFDACSSYTQGLIGYMMQQSLSNNGLKNVVCTLSRVEVSPDDPAFSNYTKPVGGFYTKEEAEVVSKEKGWRMMEDSGRGYRRVVPSPSPVRILEHKAISDMISMDYTVIACGGGGIPVKRKPDGGYTGAEAVIDKDSTAALLAKTVKSDKLVFITEVENVFLNFGKADAKKLEKVSREEMQGYLDAGHFGKGSMEPKVKAALDYVRETGGTAIICSLETVSKAIDGESGTIITPC